MITSQVGHGDWPTQSDDVMIRRTGAEVKTRPEIGGHRLFW